MRDAISALPDFSTITPEEIAAAAFLSRYKGATRKLYTGDLRLFFQWCRDVNVPPMEVERAHLEFFARHLEEDRGNMPSSVARRLNTLRGFYRVSAADGRIAVDPTVMLRMPKVRFDESRVLYLDRMQLGAMIQTARRASPAKEALIVLMGMLGLRVSEACSATIEGFADEERGHRVLRVWGKGSKPATIPLPVPVLRTLERAAEGRTAGFIVTRASGAQQDRMGAYAWVKQIARDAGIQGRVHPHAIRHASITAVLDAGVPLRDAQVFARHSDPRITTRYDRARMNLDRHPSYILAGFLAGAA